MKCGKCKHEFEEKDIEEHHCHPRFMNNSTGKGIKVDLCKKCHGMVHAGIQRIIWNGLTNEQKDLVTKQVQGYSEIFGGLE